MTEMSPNPKLEITIFSDPKHDEVVAEVYCDGKFVAFIDQDEGPNHLKLVFPDESDPAIVTRSVYLDWFLDAVQKAKDTLLNG